MAGGAWFAVGPAVSRLWDHAAGPIGGPLFGYTRQMLELVGYFYGLGVVVVGLAAFAHGRFVSRPALIIPEPDAGEPVTEPAAPEPGAGEPDRSIPGRAGEPEPTDTGPEPTDAPSSRTKPSSRHASEGP